VTCANIAKVLWVTVKNKQLEELSGLIYEISWLKPTKFFLGFPDGLSPPHMIMPELLEMQTGTDEPLSKTKRVQTPDKEKPR